MLYVTMQPKPGLSLDQFHEWYNNEHGPTRLRLPHIFANGLRYAATDGAAPHFLAAYDVTSMHHLDTPTYTDLRANRSPREADTIAQVDVQRSFYDLIAERTCDGFQPAEHLLPDTRAEGRVLIAVEATLTSADGAEAELNKWYEEEHTAMLAKVPGWLRTRRYRTAASLDDHSAAPRSKFLALHEFAKDNGLDGPEFRAATSTPWRDRIFANVLADKHRRTYALFYVFGPAPRDLASLANLPADKAFISSDGRTQTTPGMLKSYVTTDDGLSIPYQLEGNPDPHAPTIAFCNSLLTSLHMWDPLVALLKQARPEFRILRYNTRGRHAVPEPPVPVTLDMVADDLAALLAALRIDKLHALVGVSMGGATTLKFALTYPTKLDRFVACDFNVASSPANTQAWKDRIAVAEDESSTTPGSGIKKLAGMTVERWFHPNTMTAKTNVVSWMTEMVADNDVQGFRYGCQALWEYNMRDEMKTCRVPGLLVVGDGDGKGALVKAMEGFKAAVGEKGVDLKIVPEAGHLPMCESPEAFWEAIKGFL